MLPWVVVFNAVSLDGRITGFDADLDLYYQLASKIGADAVLMGSETVLKGFGVGEGEIHPEDDAIFKPREKDPEDERPLLVIPDSQGKIRIWSEILKMPYLQDVLVLCSRSTPPEYLDFLDERYIPYLVVGYQKVDLEAALEELNLQFGVKLVRVDSGGVLNGILFHDGLVDEVHVLIHPELAGNTSKDSIYNVQSENKNIPLKLANIERLNGGIVHLTYEVIK